MLPTLGRWLLSVHGRACQVRALATLGRGTSYGTTEAVVSVPAKSILALSSMSYDALGEELMKKGRHHVGKQELLDEIIRRATSGGMPPSLFRSACFVANASGLHTRCIELHVMYSRTHANKLEFALHDSVVESAFALRSSEVLEAIVKSAVWKVAHSPEEVTSELACFRALWRAVVLVASSSLASPSSSPEPDNMRALLGRSESEEDEDSGAQSCSHRSQVPTVRSLPPLVRRFGTPQQWASPRRIWSLLASCCPSVCDTEQGFGEFMVRVLRYVLYATIDDGEMLFYQHCNQYLYRTRPCASLAIANIRSCSKAGAVDVASAYFEGYLQHCQQKNAVEELVIHAYLSLLASVGNNEKIVRTVKRFLESNRSVAGATASPTARGMLGRARWSDASTASLGPSVLAQGVRAAAECRDGLFIREVAQLLLYGTTPSVVAPSGVERFTCVHALARCGTPHYEALLELCITNHIVEVDSEEICFLLLQYAINAVRPETVFRKALDTLSATSQRALSDRIVTSILQLCLRCELPSMLQHYRKYCFEGGTGPLDKPLRSQSLRRQWVDLLIIWADRRRYELSASERQFICAELAKVEISNSTSKAAQGYRNHIAMLQHDAQHEPLKHFKTKGVISPPPPLRDTRCHFLQLRAAHLSVVSSRCSLPISTLVGERGDLACPWSLRRPITADEKFVRLALMELHRLQRAVISP